MSKFGDMSITNPGDMDFTTKKGDKVYHRNKKYVRVGHKPYGYHKGTASSMFPGLMDFNTKKGNLVFHQNGKFVKKSFRPYSFHKGSRSKTHKGKKNFTTRKRKGTRKTKRSSTRKR